MTMLKSVDNTLISFKNSDNKVWREECTAADWPLVRGNERVLTERECVLRMLKTQKGKVANKGLTIT